MAPASPPAPCSPRSRRLPKLIAVQRGLPVGVREILQPVRYVVGAPHSHAPCAPATEGRRAGVTTRCYAEHSPKRKYCKLLAPDARLAAASFAPGLYLWGVPPLNGGVTLRCTSGDARDDPIPYDTLVFGPYPSGPRDLRVKCLSLLGVFGSHSYPENVAPRFFGYTGRDHAVPTPGMLQALSTKLEAVRQRMPPQARAAADNLKACADALVERNRVLQSLRVRCGRDAAFARVARQLLRNTFYYAMYARRWPGPGTPYPVDARATNRMVGRHTQVAETLRGRHVRVTPKGEVVVHAKQGDDAADRVEGGKAVAMMDAYFWAVHHTLETAPAATRAALLATPLAVDRGRDVEGGFWATEETLWQCLYTGEHAIARGQANGGACIRQMSRPLLDTCEMLMNVFYKARPEWARYEGNLDDVQ